MLLRLLTSLVFILFVNTTGTSIALVPLLERVFMRDWTGYPTTLIARHEKLGLNFLPRPMGELYYPFFPWEFVMAECSYKFYLYITVWFCGFVPSTLPNTSTSSFTKCGRRDWF